jgi:hypothetical protein
MSDILPMPIDINYLQLPDFQWHIIEDFVGFTVRGIDILPFPGEVPCMFVQHLLISQTT